MKRVAALVMIGLLTSQVADAAEPVVTNPGWLAQPDPDDIAATYPALAQYLGVEGEARVACQIDATGELKKCVVEIETPAGLGFETAILRATKYFRLSPKKVDGVPVSGGTVRIPLRYRLPASSPPPSLPTRPTVQEADAEEIAAFAKIQEQSFADRFLDFAQFAATEDGDALDPKALSDVRAAIRASLALYAPEFGRTSAAQYATFASPGGMARLIAYESSDSGRAMRRAERQADRALKPVIQRLPSEVATVLAEKLCVADRCRPAPAPPAPAASTWTEQPDKQALDRAQSMVTRVLGLGGWAMMNCVVTASSELSLCTITAESPAGLGFGKAAQSVAELYKVADGEKRAGEVVYPVVVFPAWGPAKPVTRWTANETPAPERLFAARRATAGLNLGHMLSETLGELWIDSSPDMRHALIESGVEMLLRLKEYRAIALALQADVATLDAAAAHYTGPAPWLQDASTRASREAVMQTEAFYHAATRDEVRRRICEKRKCITPDAKPPSP